MRMTEEHKAIKQAFCDETDRKAIVKRLLGVEYISDYNNANEVIRDILEKVCDTYEESLKPYLALLSKGYLAWWPLCAEPKDYYLVACWVMFDLQNRKEGKPCK